MDNQSTSSSTMPHRTRVTDPECPIRYYSTDFIKDYHEALAAAGGKVEKLELRWEPKRRRDNVIREVSYIFRITVDGIVYALKCIPVRPSRVLFWMRKTKVVMKKIKSIDEDTDDVLKSYSDVMYSSRCSKMVCRFLVFFAMYKQTEIGSVILTLPRKAIEVSALNSINTKEMTLVIHKSIENQHFLGSWLKLIGVAESVTIYSTQFSTAISINRTAREKLKTVQRLTMYGRSDLDCEFIHEFDGSQIIYKETTRQSPISLLEFVRWWQERKDKTGIRKKFVFTTIHRFYTLEEFQEELEYEGGEFWHENEKRRYAAKEGMNFVKTFEMTPNKLTIEFDC